MAVRFEPRNILSTMKRLPKIKEDEVAIPLLKELTYCSLSSPSVSSRTLLSVGTGIKRATCLRGSR
jgi:hypothetical protein